MHTLRALLVQDYVEHLGVGLVQDGDRRPVLVAQADLGYAHVAEKCMEDLLMAKGKVPPACTEDLHRKTELALACIAATKPDMTDLEASASIARAFVAENPDCYADLAVSSDALCEVLNAGEAKAAVEYANSVQKVKATKELVLKTREERIHHHFKKSAPVKYAASERKLPRWLPKRDEQNTAAITQWICSYLPSTVTVQCDDYNGRWRVISANLEWRSISWTKRGFEKAAMEVIHQAWTYHYDFSGLRAPFDLQELSKRWQEDELMVA